MKKGFVIASALAATVAFAAPAQADTYTFAGSWYVGEGPIWNGNPTVYSALETAALLFGGNASDYAISTLGNDPNQINFMAHVDGWGDDQYLFSTVAQDYKLDTGAPGYNDPYGGPSYSAYVLDHSCYNRYTSPNQGCTDTAIGQNFAFRINGAVPEPGTWAMLVLGFGMMGASLRRRRAESNLRPA